MNRRFTLMTGMAAALLPKASKASLPREITWEDLIPPGVPFAEIIGDGEMDYEADTWIPEFDENALKLNEELNGAYIKMPGFIIPMEHSSQGVTGFILVPYVGACIHIPPPPANQLVYVTSKTAWPSKDLWEAVWVTGTMRTKLQTTELAQIGYALDADHMEIYVW